MNSTLPAKNLLLRGEVIKGLQRNIIHGGRSIQQIPESIGTLIDNDAWEEWIDPDTDNEHTYDSFEEFAKAPIPDGLGIEDRQKLIDLCHGYGGVQRKIRKKWPVEYQDSPGNPTGNNQYSTRQESLSDNDSSSRGTSADYLLDRLRKEAPELRKKVDIGEMTASAATTKAGIRPRRAEIYPDDTQRTARILLRHFDADELIAAIEEARQ